nr:MAG TPA: hypothetical protein [Bacteriophage sp.]
MPNYVILCCTMNICIFLKCGRDVNISTLFLFW